MCKPTMGNCIGKSCGYAFESFGQFWSVHGLPIHFIALFSMLCFTGMCPWIAMLGFIPLSYLSAKYVKKSIKKYVKRKSLRKQMERMFEEMRYDRRL